MIKFIWYLYFLIKSVLFHVNILLNITHVIDDDRVKEVISLLKPVRIQSDLIRIGGGGDGGYLIPDDLDGIEYCFSPGVSTYAPFEIELEKHGIRSFLADYSVERAPTGLEKAEFIKKFITSRENETSSTLKKWIDDSIGNNYEGDMILQMDIEGYEYEVLFETSISYLKKFRIIVIEFHGLHGMFDKLQLGFIEHIFKKITSEFNVVHLHPNNFAPALCTESIEVPDIMEITFLRKDREIKESGILKYPHALDRRCSSYRRDFPLPGCWHED